jgi:deazaflavin-dependent oxidoreductase (nitroreductase family)
MSDWNDQVIAEFRANAGQLGGNFEGSPVLLLHTTGAKSGAERVHPVMYDQVGDDVIVFASYAGADVHPAWYFNLLAHPEAWIEIGADTVDVVARVATSDEREPIWSDWKKRFPGFAGYEEKTDREIPVVILARA